VFEQARQAVSRQVLETIAPRGEWRGPEYWAPSPLRGDSDSSDSFHIFEDASGWCFKDFVNGEGGDIIHLVELCHGCTPLDAAKWILEQAGQPVPESAPKKGRKPKPAWRAAPDGTPLVVPSARVLNIDHAEPLPPPSLATPYRLADRTIAYTALRWDAGVLEKEKVIRPVYPTESGTWWSGVPEQFKRARILLGLHRFKEPRPGLLVEGEKKAGLAVQKVSSRLVTSWHGGVDNAEYLDTSPIQDWPDWVMWPDHDLKKWSDTKRDIEKAKKYGQKPGDIKPNIEQPGCLAALAIKKKLPQLQILDVWEMGEANGKDGWDVADCIAEGYNPETFISECPRLEVPDEKEEPEPFRHLGYDKKYYWFLKGAQRIPAQIEMGRFSASLLGELASPSWWESRGALSDEGNINITKGQQIIIEGSTARGFFRPEVLRGSGVWLEDGKPLINDGDNIIDLEGKSVPIEEYKPAPPSVYIRSQLRFDAMTGDESTPSEGKILADLFSAQGFTSLRGSVALLGWSLSAPFAGVLPWRPIAWLLGKTSNGKSWLVENIVVPLCGEFRYWGSKTTTEPAIRRGTNMIACPVILDEQTPKAKSEREALAKRIELAKTSSGDSSGTSQIATGTDTTAVFVNRSPFLFVGTNFPDVAAEIQNRTVTCELKPVQTSDEMARKIERSAPLYTKSMKDPARYRRRIFHALPRILEDIVYLRGLLPAYLGGQRMADVWAPLFAASWAVQSDKSIQDADGEAWIQPYLDEAVMHGADVEDDEDRVIEHILAAQIESDDKRKKTIAEWLEIGEMQLPESDPAAALVVRHGLRVLVLQGRKYLAIACKHDQLFRILRDTSYADGYDAQVRRNPLCVNTTKTKQERMGAVVIACRLLMWTEFRERYMGKGEDE